MNGDELRMARNFKKITQYQLALMTGVFQSRISLVENGLRILTDEEERKIKSALGLFIENIGPDGPRDGEGRGESFSSEGSLGANNNG